MSLETQIQSRISSLAGVQVYAMQAEKNKRPPYIVWQDISGVPQNTHEDVATIKKSLVQIACYSTVSAAAAKAIRSDAIAALEGNHSDGPIYVSIERDSFDDDAAAFRADVDVTVWSGS